MTQVDLLIVPRSGSHHLPSFHLFSYPGLQPPNLFQIPSSFKANLHLTLSSLLSQKPKVIIGYSLATSGVNVNARHVCKQVYSLGTERELCASL